MKEIWLARDKNNTLCIYDGESKPIKDKATNEWIFGNFIGFLILQSGFDSQLGYYILT